MSPDSFRRSGQPRDETPACHLSPHLWTNHFSHRLDDRRPTNWQKMALRSFCSRVHSQGSVAHRSRSDGTYMAYRCARSRHSTAEAVIFTPEQDGNRSDHCARSRSTRIAQRSREPFHSLLLQDHATPKGKKKRQGRHWAVNKDDSNDNFARSRSRLD